MQAYTSERKVCEKLPCASLGHRLTMALAVVVSATALMVCAGTTRAAIVYGDFAGDTVTYEDVAEDDQGFYGTPTISGDTLAFTPTGFAAEASDGEMDLVDGNISMAIRAQDGQAIDSLFVRESGRFSLLGAPGFGTDFTHVFVKFSIDITILEIDGTNIPGGVTLQFDEVMADFNLLDDGTNLNEPWLHEVTVDIDGLLANAGYFGDATLITVGINNMLLATSEDNTIARIDKKAINGLTITVPVPEPASLALLAAGTLLVGYGRFRRRAR